MLLFALLVFLLKVLAPPITIFAMVRKVSENVPGVKVTPRPLTDYSISDAPGTTLSYFGYGFEVPWNAEFKTKTFGERGLVQLQFESGQNVTFISPTNQGGLLTEITQDRSMHMENLQLIFGDLMNRSAYDQYSALLNASPATIRAFGPRSKAVQGVTLLTIKAIALPSNLETGVFSFALQDKRGFQIGDPRRSRRVDLEVLDIRGHYVEIICASGKDGPNLTQPELNRMLKSLRLVSVDYFAAHAASTKGQRN